MSELLPCPFCGGEAEVHPSSDWNTRFSGKTFFVWCDKCETRGDYYNTEAEAIAAWNTRAELTCRNDKDKWNRLAKYLFVCSECGWNLADVGNDAIDISAMLIKRCPNCGAKVVGE